MSDWLCMIGSPTRTSGFRRLQIHDSCSDVGEPFVGLGLFVEGLLEEVGGVVIPQKFGVSPCAAIGGNLVMLDPLGRTDETGVYHGRLPGGLGPLVALVDQP